MQYLPLFLLFMAVLIAAWFYLQRAKTRTRHDRDDGQSDETVADASRASPTPPTPRISRSVATRGLTDRASSRG